jgi:hypothetical protein
VTLTTEQRTRIRDTILSDRNVPRENDVNISLNVGTAVPSSVRIAEVPRTLIDIHPEWRGHSYFVVRDDIVIVDRDRHVVATVPIGASGGARLETQGGVMNIGQAEIREIQIELNRMGFNVGEPDGKLGARTKEALTMFQRQKGLNATGEIDRETFAALRPEGGQRGDEGNAAEGERGNRPATTGQGSDRRQPSTNQRQPANEPRAK